uniref:CCHC-type domain-containing protein n=1 Tax=Romanomermis culicivorax TaxID=13658 RepID=A0A915JA51_ROMCU
MKNVTNLKKKMQSQNHCNKFCIICLKREHTKFTCWKRYSKKIQCYICGRRNHTNVECWFNVMNMYIFEGRMMEIKRQKRQKLAHQMERNSEAKNIKNETEVMENDSQKMEMNNEDNVITDYREKVENLKQRNKFFKDRD